MPHELECTMQRRRRLQEDFAFMRSKHDFDLASDVKTTQSTKVFHDWIVKAPIPRRHDPNLT